MSTPTLKAAVAANIINEYQERKNKNILLSSLRKIVRETDTQSYQTSGPSRGNIWEKVNALQEHLRLNDAQFAQKCGFSVRALTSWSNYDRQPGKSTLQKIANACDIPVADLEDYTKPFPWETAVNSYPLRKGIIDNSPLDDEAAMRKINALVAETNDFNDEPPLSEGEILSLVYILRCAEVFEAYDYSIKPRTTAN